jgi:hypothetical protein
MKYFRVLSIFLILSNQLLYGQSLKFELQPGVGFYSMSCLNDINDAVSQDIPFETRLVSDFPAYWYLRPVLSLQFKKFSVGLNYSFQSTGSRVSAKDYSGEYNFDMKVNSSSSGIYGEVTLVNLKKIRFNLYSAIGISYSRLSLNEYLIVLDQKLTDDSYRYKGQNYFFEPGFNISYPVLFFNIGLYSGYFFGFGKQAYYTNNDKSDKLYIPGSRESIKPDWNGFRLGILVYYNLKMRTK